MACGMSLALHSAGSVLSNHKPASQASGGLYGSRFDCFLETQLAERLPPTQVRAPDFHLGLGADPEYTLLLHVSQKTREAESFVQCQPASRGIEG